MKNLKFILLSVLLIALISVGFGCTNSPKAFYKRACKISVPMQEKLEDFYDYDASEIGSYDDVDECIEESLENEEEAYENCLEEEDEEECQERIDEWRELIMEMLTREGCEDMHDSECAYYEPTSEMKKYSSNQEIRDMEEKYDECMEDVKELCEDLPKNF